MQTIDQNDLSNSTTCMHHLANESKFMGQNNKKVARKMFTGTPTVAFSIQNTQFMYLKLS